MMRVVVDIPLDTLKVEVFDGCWSVFDIHQATDDVLWAIRHCVPLGFSSYLVLTITTIQDVRCIVKFYLKKDLILSFRLFS